jgi:hypothetical protein
MADPYNVLEYEMKYTYETLKMFLKYKIPAAILTKAGTKCLRDLEIFKKFGKHIKIGATLTMDNDKDSRSWEPNAALPNDRLEMLSALHSNGITTWASFEPVINIDQSLGMMHRSLNCVDIYKIGKLNNFQGLDKGMDWTRFLSLAVGLLRSNNKSFYVKHDLRIAAPSVLLRQEETDMNRFNLPAFDISMKQDEQQGFFE